VGLVVGISLGFYFTLGAKTQAATSSVSEIQGLSAENELTDKIRAEEIRSPEEIKIVESNIRAITNNPDLELSFKSRVSNPYTNVIVHKVEYYEDEKGTQYIIDSETNKVVAFTYNDHFVVEDKNKLPNETLKAKAEALLSKNVENFAEVKDNFKLEEGSKGDMYVLRYDAKDKVTGEDMLPFVQVKLATDGRLIGFSDIRNLYR